MSSKVNQCISSQLDEALKLVEWKIPRTFSFAEINVLKKTYEVETFTFESVG